MPYRPYRPGLPKECFIPEGYIPILEAASLLAFGDAEFKDHLREREGPCPEIDRECDRLIDQHKTGEITIIGRRRTVPEWHNKARNPRINNGEIHNKYEKIPLDYFLYNDWVVSPYDPFNVFSKGSNLYNAEWFYPAVAESEIEKLRHQLPSCNRLTNDKEKYGDDLLGKAIKAVISLGKVPLKTCQWAEFCYLVRERGGVPIKARGWDDRTIKRRMGRK
jgi:hypothetical protein